MRKFAVSLNARESDGGVFDYLMHTYAAYLQTLEIAPILIPNNIDHLETYIPSLDLDGVVLTGGGDLDPQRYQQGNSHAVRIVPERDHTEFSLLLWAVGENLPLIGICRGIQTINVYFGGGLVQDIPAQIGNAVDHDDTTHPVTITDDQIADLLGTREIVTNSHHHQGVSADLLAPDLVPFAISADGVIEGVYHREKPIIGVQWHPERPTPSRESDLALFRHFLDQGAFWTINEQR